MWCVTMRVCVVLVQSRQSNAVFSPASRMHSYLRSTVKINVICLKKRRETRFSINKGGATQQGRSNSNLPSCLVSFYKGPQASASYTTLPFTLIWSTNIDKGTLKTHLNRYGTSKQFGKMCVCVCVCLSMYFCLSLCLCLCLCLCLI